jgi:hypothetical protein
MYGGGAMVEDFAAHDIPNAENARAVLGGDIPGFAGAEDNCVWYWLHLAGPNGVLGDNDDIGGPAGKFVRMNAAKITDNNCATGLCVRWGGYGDVPINNP